MNPSPDILAKHRQIAPNSCIPMAVELVLKLLGRMPVDSFDQQEQWQNRADGSFANYNNRTINRVRFSCQFALPRDQNFPLENLFETISRDWRKGDTSLCLWYLPVVGTCSLSTTRLHRVSLRQSPTSMARTLHQWLRTFGKLFVECMALTF